MISKRFALLLIWALALSLAVPGFAATIEFHLNDFRIAGSLSNRVVRITPTDGVATNESWLIIPERQNFRTDATGYLSVSNVVIGIYRIDAVGTLGTNTFWIDVPTSTSTINAATIKYTPTTTTVGLASAYTAAASDARYGRKTNGVFTNAAFYGTFAYLTDALPGYVLTSDGTFATWAELPESVGGINYNLITSSNLPFAGVTGLAATNAGLQAQITALAARGTNYDLTTSSNLPIAGVIGQAATNANLQAQITVLNARGTNYDLTTSSNLPISGVIGQAATNANLQAQISAIPALYSDADLKKSVAASAYEFLTLLHDAATDVVTNAVIKWPDGTFGAYTCTSLNTAAGACDAYTVTYTNSGKTITQAAVTRSASYSVLTVPALVVTP